MLTGRCFPANPCVSARSGPLWAELRQLPCQPGWARCGGRQARWPAAAAAVDGTPRRLERLVAHTTGIIALTDAICGCQASHAEEEDGQARGQGRASYHRDG